MSISVFSKTYARITKRLLSTAVIESGDTSIHVSAQWDIGATGTCISRKVVNRLSLLPTGMVNVRTPSGVGQMHKYMVDVVLDNEVRIPNLSVMDSEIGSQGIGILIGMDIITLGDFAVSNYRNTTQFSFRIPSQEHIVLQ